MAWLLARLLIVVGEFLIALPTLPEDTDPCGRRFLDSATIDSCRASAQEENAPVPPGLERSRVEDVSPGFKYLLKKEMPPVPPEMRRVCGYVQASTKRSGRRKAMMSHKRLMSLLVLLGVLPT